MNVIQLAMCYYGATLVTQRMGQKAVAPNAPGSKALGRKISSEKGKKNNNYES